MNERYVGTAGVDASDRVEVLLRGANTRERPPAAMERDIRARLEAEWQAGARRRRRFRSGLAVAASILLVLAAIVVQRTGREPALAPAKLARVELAEGYVRVTAGDAQGSTVVVQAGADVHAGQEIRTDSRSRLALRWRDGSSVRVDRNARLRLTPTGGLELLQGRLYVDTGDADSAESIFVETPAGVIRHLGTRYMATVDAAVTRISVRGGRVQLGAGAGPIADGGQELFVQAGGETELRPVATYGDAWIWTEALAPTFASDGRSLADLVEWVSRETGYEVEFSTPEAAAHAAGTKLRGSLDLEPMRALEAALPTGSLASEVHNGVISVRLATVD